MFFKIQFKELNYKYLNMYFSRNTSMFYVILISLQK